MKAWLAAKAEKAKASMNAMANDVKAAASEVKAKANEKASEVKAKIEERRSASAAGSSTEKAPPGFAAEMRARQLKEEAEMKAQVASDLQKIDTNGLAAEEQARMQHAQEQAQKAAEEAFIAAEQARRRRKGGEHD